MQKKLVNSKRDVLKRMEPRDLVDHICKYPNQDFLNFNEDGKRKIPVGAIAHNIQDNKYSMSDAQYYTLIHHFAAITVPDVKVVGVTFYKNNPEDFARNQISDDGNGHQIYEIDYMLTPEPTNAYDVNAVSVDVKGTTSEDGMVEYHHIGYLPADFVAIHPIGGEMEVHGMMKDSSNGKFKNVSYQLPLDLEVLNANNMSLLQASDMGISEELEDEVYRHTSEVDDNDITLSDEDLVSLLPDTGLEL